MEWDEQDRLALQSFKDTVDCDDIKVKEQIKKVLLNNRFIVKVLDNKTLEDAEAEPDDYFPDTIKPYYYVIPSTQTDNQNYLCFDVGYKELDRYNDKVKILQITFYILCYQGDIIEADTGLARHDLLAALIQDQFNWTTYFGSKIKLVSDIPSATDTNYATRTLVFEQTTDNSLVKSRPSQILNDQGVLEVQHPSRLYNKKVQKAVK